MVFQRIYHEGLAQASYLIGCTSTGLAIVIDPTRDFERYLDEARNFGLRITAVTETHIHADYLSGAREFAELTAAKLYLSDEGTADWKYHFLESAGATPLYDGSTFNVGEVKFDVLKTPGHTPEHICFLLTDEATSSRPSAFISGDFIFCGDVGRPDLLETAAGIEGAMAEGARTLFASLKATGNLRDDLLIWPGHGAGSACGKALSAVPVSTLGYERASSWAFQINSESQFVDEVLSGQPDPPAYFAMMKKLNRDGPPKRGTLTPLRSIDLSNVSPERSQVVDLRSFEEFCSGHLPGSITLPRYRNFITYAGSVLNFSEPIAFIAHDATTAEAARHDLAMIGLDQIEGLVHSKELESAELETLRSMTAAEFERQSQGYELLDVRNRNEWSMGHLKGVTHIPYPTIARRLEELNKHTPIAVFCQGGARSGTAASLLAAKGFKNVVDISDGFPGLAEAMAADRQRMPVH